jgi:alcohol dehydrogenase class IV
MNESRSIDAPLRSGVYENWHQWRKVEHGEGCLRSLGAEIARLGIRRPFVVTTRSLVREANLLASVHAAMGAESAGQFSDCQPHTPREVVLAAVIAAGRARPDGIVSFGGSTVVDTGKALSLALAADVESWGDFDRDAPGAIERLRRDPIPHIALPTTLSGAEYSCDIGITNERLRKKEIFRHDGVTPRSILLDPALTLATPDRLWSATGVKVMSDAIEQLYGKASHPIIDALCLSAIRAFHDNLPLSRHPDRSVQLDARLRCQVASWKTLFGMTNAGTRVGIGGALRHQLGGMFRIAHGEATCVMLPHLLRFNFPAVPDRYRALAEALGIEAADDDARLAAIVRAVERLIAALGLPDRLEPLGVRREDLPAMAAHVMDETSLRFNPREVTDAREVVTVLEAAL